MAKDHGTPKAGQLPRVWTKSRRDRESPKSERRRVKAVLGRVSTGAAGRILDSANPKEIRA